MNDSLQLITITVPEEYEALISIDVHVSCKMSQN